MTDKKTEDAINDAVEDGALPEDTSGLKAKITELLAALAAEKKAKTTAESKLKTANSANLSEAEQLKQDADTARQEAADAKNALRKMKAEHAIAKAIAEGNVDAKHVRAVSAILTLELDQDSDEPTIGNKSVGDYVKSYLKSEGLSYVRAAENSGGLAQGNDGSKASKINKRPVTHAEWVAFDALSDAERNAVCDQIGAPELKV